MSIIVLVTVLAYLVLLRSLVALAMAKGTYIRVTDVHRTNVVHFTIALCERGPELMKPTMVHVEHHRDSGQRQSGACLRLPPRHFRHWRPVNRANASLWPDSYILCWYLRAESVDDHERHIRLD